MPVKTKRLRIYESGFLARPRLLEKIVRREQSDLARRDRPCPTRPAAGGWPVRLRVWLSHRLLERGRPSRRPRRWAVRRKRVPANPVADTQQKTPSGSDGAKKRVKGLEPSTASLEG